MKKAMVGVMVLLAGIGFAELETTVDTTVSYQVKKVKIQSMMVTRTRSDLIMSVPYSWLDGSNKVIRTGGYRANKAQLESQLGDNGAVVTGILDRMVPTNGVSPMLVFSFNRNGEVTAFSRSIEGIGTNRVVNTVRYGTNEVKTAIAPITVEQFKFMVQEVTKEVLK